MIVVCIPLIFKVRAVMAGWVKGVGGLSDGGIGSVSGALRGGVVSVLGCGGAGWSGSRLAGVSMARFDACFWECSVCVVGKGCHALHSDMLSWVAVRVCEMRPTRRRWVGFGLWSEVDCERVVLWVRGGGEASWV